MATVTVFGQDYTLVVTTNPQPTNLASQFDFDSFVTPVGRFYLVHDQDQNTLVVRIYLAGGGLKEIKVQESILISSECRLVWHKHEVFFFDSRLHHHGWARIIPPSHEVTQASLSHNHVSLILDHQRVVVWTRTEGKLLLEHTLPPRQEKWLYLYQRDHTLDFFILFQESKQEAFLLSFLTTEASQTTLNIHHENPLIPLIFSPKHRHQAWRNNNHRKLLPLPKSTSPSTPRRRRRELSLMAFKLCH